MSGNNDEEMDRNLMETSEGVDTKTLSPSSPSLSSTQEPQSHQEEEEEEKMNLLSSPNLKIDEDGDEDDDVDLENNNVIGTDAVIPVASSSSSYNESEDVVSNTNEFLASNEENPEISSNTSSVNADSSNLSYPTINTNINTSTPSTIIINNNNHIDNNLTASSTTNLEMKDNIIMSSVASCSLDSEVNNEWNENQMDCETSTVNLITTTSTPTATTTITTTTNYANSNDTNLILSGPMNKRTFGCASSSVRIKLDESTFNHLDRKELWSKWRKQDEYIDLLEAKIESNSSKNDVNRTKELEERLKQQQIDACRRENTLVMRLTTKEQEVADLLNRIQAMREELIPSEARLNSTLLDPALNLLFERMGSEVISSRERVEQMQNELAAWKFTTDSHMGKQLMAKCQALYKENEELGKTIESGRIGKMEGELALQKSFVEELKKSQMETDEFLFELDEEVEGLQATILHLRNQMKDLKSTESDLRPPTEFIEKLKEVKTN